jgi:hypothetical protein
LFATERRLRSTLIPAEAAPRLRLAGDGTVLRVVGLLRVRGGPPIEPDRPPGRDGGWLGMRGGKRSGVTVVA